MGETNIFGIVAACVGAVLLFAPLGVVLVVAAKAGRGRVLAWAFGGSLAVVLFWLAVAAGLRATMTASVAGWWLLGAPWASAMGAVAGWRLSLRAETRAAARPEAEPSAGRG